MSRGESSSQNEATRAIADMPLQLADEVVRILRAAGWQEGRRVDTHEERRYLEEFGFTVNPAAEAFLAEFHGLHFDLPNGPHDFDVHKSVFWMTKDEVPVVSRLTGESLCPVGYGGRTYMLLSPSSKAFFLHDEWLGLIGPVDIPEAMRIFLCSPSLGASQWAYLAEDQKPVEYRGE